MPLCRAGAFPMGTTAVPYMDAVVEVVKRGSRPERVLALGELEGYSESSERGVCHLREVRRIMRGQNDDVPVVQAVVVSQQNPPPQMTEVRRSKKLPAIISIVVIFIIIIAATFALQVQLSIEDSQTHQGSLGVTLKNHGIGTAKAEKITIIINSDHEFDWTGDDIGPGETKTAWLELVEVGLYFVGIIEVKYNGMSQDKV